MSSFPGGQGSESADFVVIGGGIAGVTCAETLSALCTDEKIFLITASALIKAVTNLQQVSRALESFDVTQRPVESLQSDCPNVRVIQGGVHTLDSENHTILLDGQRTVTYKKLCICTGGKPKLICEDNPWVLGIRDTDSVQVFQQKLSCARRVLVVGNGGIATELVYELSGCEVVWAVKDDTISSLYLDPGAAQFLLPNLTGAHHADTGPLKRHKYTISDVTTPRPSDTPGGALGPDWAERVCLEGAAQTDGPQVHVEYGVQIRRVWTDQEFKDSGKTATKPGSTNKDGIGDWRVYVELTRGVIYGCDIVVSATGVQPFTCPFLQGNQFKVAEDGGLCVNDKMRTSVADVFAAGDVCTASWEIASLWHQMRLWTQARQMGCYAAKCMLAELLGQDIHMDFCFELFAHVTKFFNYKVVLLGKYNGHNLGSDYSVIVRVTEGKEYVKTVMYDGKMVGATLIGETDLEETFENLILNQTDLTRFGEDLLDPGVDIEDYFD